MPVPEPDRSGFVELNRTRLRLWDWGDPAAPPVICVHGAYDHGRMWDGLAPELAAALRRAADAHGEHEKRIGKHDTLGWPDWYAEYIVAEQTGKPLPT